MRDDDGVFFSAKRDGKDGRGRGSICGENGMLWGGRLYLLI